MNGGGCVYIEGSNVGYNHYYTDFFDFLGAGYIHFGGQNLIDNIYGVEGTFTAPNEFSYPDGDSDYKVDELSAGEGLATLVCQQDKVRAILYNGGNYRAITSSIIIGVLPNSEGSSTKALLMERYLKFLTGNMNTDIWISHDEIDFGIQYAEYETTISLKIQNLGLADLNISAIALTGEYFSIECEPPYMLGIGDEVELTVSFLSSEAGVYAGTITISSNDPDENQIEIDLLAECLLPPTIVISDDEIYARVGIGETAERTLTISNNGNSDLSFDIELVDPDLAAESSSIDYATSIADITLAKGEYDYREGPPVICGFGGPDQFGYTWVDSDEPNGPRYDWFDISSIGQNSGLYGDDAGVILFLPFDFEFYGNIKNSVMVSTNGYLIFGTEGGFYTNASIPTPASPNDLICPFWDDLHQQSGTNYYYYDEANRRFIIQYDNWGYFSGGGNITFQVHLCENGAFYFYYENMNGTTTSATVGIENDNGTDGLQMTFNSSYVRSNMAVRISTGPPWLSVDIDEATVPMGSSQDVTFTLDARGIVEGEYNANAIFYSNDPANPEVIIPVTMLAGIVGVDDASLPYVTRLKGNYPNPFNASTIISFDLNERTPIKLDIFNVLGQRVATLVDEVRDTGSHRVVWQADVSTGIYFCKMTAGDCSSTRKMVLMK